VYREPLTKLPDPATVDLLALAKAMNIDLGQFIKK
jgi:hypothetical protein